jgi:small subunit ribosomal protein S8e
MSKRKPSGGRKRSYRKKKKFEIKRFLKQVRLDEQGVEVLKVLRVRGGNRKAVLLRSNFANVVVGNSIKRVKILNVVETPSNRFFAKSNIITKGTIIDTELGRAKVTNRPGQEGMINAVLIEKAEKEKTGK